MKKFFFILVVLLFPLSAFAGTQAYTTPGAYTFTVPSYGTLTLEVWGGGGAGGGGSNGGQSSWNNTLIAGGGKSTLYAPGAGGIASGGDINTPGASGISSGNGGASPNGGAGGNYIAGWSNPAAWTGVAPGGGGAGEGGGGGSGAYAKKTYSAGVLSVGTNIPVVVGAGGATGGAPSLSVGASARGPGAVGAVKITWTPAQQNCPIHSHGTYPACVCDTGYTGNGQTGSALVCTDITAPSVPTALTATVISPTQINLSWSPSIETGGSGLVGYKIYRNGTQIATSVLNSYSNTGLTPSTAYTYTVSAYDAIGNTSARSASVSATTGAPAPVPVVTLSASPTSVMAGGSSTLTWSSTNATSCTASGGWSGNKAVSGSQILTGLTSTATYTLVCTGAGGSVTKSATITVTPVPDTTAPSIPTGLSGTAVSSTQINLTWVASTDNVGVTGYKIFRDGIQVATSTTVSFSSTGLTASTTYSYMVSAYDAAGNVSGQSVGVLVKTMPLSMSLTLSAWPSTGVAPVTVIFTLSQSRVWLNFGDGIKLFISGTSTSHRYTTAGTYTAYLCPQADANCTPAATASVTTVVAQNAPPAIGVNWNIQTTNYVSGSTGYYNSFFINGSTMTMYNNHGLIYAAGQLTRGIGNLAGIPSWQILIPSGPEVALQWLRAPAVVKGSDGKWWTIVEATQCYSCASPRRVLTYTSNDGVNWTYLGMTMLGALPMPSWQGTMALVYQPEKPNVIDLNDPTNNRFVYIVGKLLTVSADGINFKVANNNWPFAGDDPVFASLAKTPYGWHLMAGDKWLDCCGVIQVRHLFSTDLKTWKVLETATTVKAGIKGVNLYYEAATNRLWAYSHSGVPYGGGRLFWFTAKSF